MTLSYEADPTACQGVLGKLAALGYSETGVAERLGLADLNDLNLKARPIYRQERLQARDPLDCAIELLLLQGALRAAEVDRLFQPSDQEQLVKAGVLELRDGLIQATASLYPVGRNLIFSDHACPQLSLGGDARVPQDGVMYVGTDSRWLARATVRTPVARALDLCCGSGIQALLAAGHAEQVTAVDLNPRAVRCSAFNARAAGLRNLACLQGDLYAPVGDRSFDLITANPPFVPAPAQEVGFRDGGPSGEDVQRRIVAGLARHLAPGGMAQIVTEVGEREGEPLETRVRAWLQGAPMDLQILRLRVHPAQVYALGHADGEDGRTLMVSVGRWAANLKAQGYDRIVSVLLAFQWSAQPWTRVDEAEPPRRDAGSELASLFQAERLARDPGLEARLRLGSVARSGPVALREARALGAPQTLASIQARRLGQAMPIEYFLDPLERDLLGCLDTPMPTADLLALGTQAGLAEAQVLEALIALLRKGLLHPQ